MDSVPPEQILQEISAFKSHFSVIHGDFNARSKSWWNIVNNTNEGIKIDVGTSSYSLQQLISQPTHLLANPSS